MNSCIQAKLDFSIFILQFNFFNGFDFLESPTYLLKSGTVGAALESTSHTQLAGVASDLVGEDTNVVGDRL